MSEADIDAQLRKPDAASITISDPRLSKGIAWVWGLIGAGIAGSFLLAANNLYQLNLTVARAADNDAIVNAQIKDHEDRLRNVERDLATVNGKVFRGVSGYEEPTRGH